MKALIFVYSVYIYFLIIQSKSFISRVILILNLRSKGNLYLVLLQTKLKSKTAEDCFLVLAVVFFFLARIHHL